MDSMTPADRLDQIAADLLAMDSDSPDAHALRLGAAALRDSELLPIDGAPKDGRMILGWSEDRGFRQTYWRVPCVGSINHAKGYPGDWDWDNDMFISSWKPTHYRPLPSQPKEGK